MNDPYFIENIIGWYEKHKRSLPWRETKDPYKIWLSEIILQQTRVKQGLPYYEKFVVQYPTVEALASAEQQEVLRLWQGLGYYSRARNMQTTAQFIVQQLNSEFPKTYQDLLQLKGIGKYTAAAIASFAYNEKVAVLDGNVYRVLSRYFGIDTDIASSKGAKEFNLLAQSLIPENRAGTYNQAIMEFGAMLCSPQKPNCMYCPLQGKCEAYRLGMQLELPVKIKKIKTKERFFNYLIFYQQNEFLMRERTGKEIWQGLYDFYLIEESGEKEIEDIMENELLKSIGGDIIVHQASEIHKHVLTHQLIKARFFHIEVMDKDRFIQGVDKGFAFYDLEQLKDLPKPILIHNYLQKHFF